MRSRAELRRLVEWVLRAALVALLGVALWRSTRAGQPGAEHRTVTTGTLRRTLEEATRSPDIGGVDLVVDASPSAAELRWLAALGRAGLTVRWRGAPPSLAVVADRVREPQGAVGVSLAADSGTTVAIGDSAGALDTLRVGHRGGGASLRASEIVGAVSARQGAYVATAAPSTGQPPRAALVLGRAGWESKFVLAALGEAGWTVRARLPAAPGVSVTDPALLPIDTTRYDVVIALDSTAADLAPAVVRFVASGGGLVIAGSATHLDSFRALTPALAGARLPGRILLDGDTVTPAALPLRPLGAVRTDAVVLDRQAKGVAVVARRAGQGRVLALGYDESWRWRMLGGAGGVEAHRRWWSRNAGLVAPEHDSSAPLRGSADAAPTATLVNVLGPAAPSFSAPQRSSSPPLPLTMLVLICVVLLAETASRRFRGAR
jgi:hypothetical protein